MAKGSGGGGRGGDSGGGRALGPPPSAREIARGARLQAVRRVQGPGALSEALGARLGGTRPARRGTARRVR